MGKDKLTSDAVQALREGSKEGQKCREGRVVPHLLAAAVQDGPALGAISLVQDELQHTAATVRGGRWRDACACGRRLCV